MEKLFPSAARWLLLIVIGVIVYCASLGHGFSPYDDTAYITENRYVNQGLSLEGIKWAFLGGGAVESLPHAGVQNLWHPLTWLSHMLDVQAFGVEQAGGHHAVSVVLYLFTALLVLWSMSLLLKNPWMGFLVALLWMVHPLKVESVAWLSERKDLLSGLFFWAALGCAIKSFYSESKLWYGLGYFAFTLALLSKPSVVILPALIVLVEWYVRERNASFDLVKATKRWGLWFITSGVVALITVKMQAGGSHQFFMAQSSVVDRIFMAGYGLGFYLQRIIIPLNLNFEYDYPSLPRTVYGLSWALVVIAGILTWKFRERARAWFLGFCWFMICWLPASGLMYVGSSFTADRYMYLAFAGLCIPLVVFLERFPRTKTFIGIAPIVLLWSFLSWKQVGVWKDGYTLFKHATMAQPTLSTGWINLGVTYQKRGESDKAEVCYLKAAEVDPNAYQAWGNIGNTRKKRGDIEGGVRAYERALEIYPTFTPALYNLGVMKKDQGLLEEARELFARGKSDLRMLFLLCDVELKLGNYKAAEEALSLIEQKGFNTPEITKQIASARAYIESRKGR